MGKQIHHEDLSGRALNKLEGSWVGEGYGGFPTIDPFDYRETLTFTRRDENTLFYDQRTEKRPSGQTAFVTSHWESGYLRRLESNEFELINSQSNGRSEHLIGTFELEGEQITLNFVSQGLMNDERMVASSRRWEIKGDTLRYQMAMRTTRVDESTTHLTAVLHRKQQ